MPAICVDCNGNRLATVNTAGFDVLAVHVSGAQDQEEVATLDFSGGSYGQVPKVSLTWIAAMPLKVGDTVSISLTEPVAAGDAGKTFEELFPDSGPADEVELPALNEEFFAEIASRPRHHGGFIFCLESSAGTRYSGSTQAPESAFHFHVLWDFTREESARVGLSTTSLDNVRKRQPGREHVKETLALGETVSFRVIATCLHYPESQLSETPV